MNIKEDIRPISYVKSNAADVLAQVNETKRPLYVTQNGEARAVLMDTESYQNMQKAIGMLKLISQGENDIHKGKFIKQDEVYQRLSKKLRG